jgi:hypothetical protein
LFVLLLLAGPAFADDKKPEFTVHTGHFEKNTSGLKGDASFLLYKDAAEFEKVFGTVPPAGLGAGRKSNPVTKEVLDKMMVVAVIKRGKAITTYTEVSATADGETLTVKYTAETGAPGTATFASPLVVAVPKGKITKVVFVENGKEVGTAK